MSYYRDMSMSESGHHALKDMVELQMYLVAQLAERPWPLMPRGVKALAEFREPYCNSIELAVANELLQLGVIEYSSTLTLVVSKVGNEFYQREIKQTTK
jgi:hypothetical protein